MRPVVVVGDAGVDVLTRPRLPVVDGGESPADIRLAPGGAAANTAVWLASYGVPVTLVSRVGDDEAGRAARHALEGAGVVCRFTVDAALPTCVVVVLVDAEGGRTMLSDRGANAVLSPDDLDLTPAPQDGPQPAVLVRPHLHLSGYVLLSPTSRAAGLAALARARELRWTTSVDPQSAELVAEVGAEALLGWVEGVDLLLPNEVELEALGGAARVLRSVGAVAATYGADGARWFALGAEPLHVPAPPVRCRDSTGSGDAFNAGVLAATSRLAGPKDALLAGVTAGSTAATADGARPA